MLYIYVCICLYVSTIDFFILKECFTTFYKALIYGNLVWYMVIKFGTYVLKDNLHFLKSSRQSYMISKGSLSH